VLAGFVVCEALSAPRTITATGTRTTFIFSPFLCTQSNVIHRLFLLPERVITAPRTCGYFRFVRFVDIKKSQRNSLNQNEEAKKACCILVKFWIRNRYSHLGSASSTHDHFSHIVAVTHGTLKHRWNKCSFGINGNSKTVKTPLEFEHLHRCNSRS
jgi:hypothetical protein